MYILPKGHINTLTDTTTAQWLTWTSLDTCSLIYSQIIIPSTVTIIIVVANTGLCVSY